MSNLEKKDDKAEDKSPLIAEMIQKYSIPNIDLNELFFRYFGVFGSILSDISNSLLSRLLDDTLNSYKPLKSLQTQIDALKDEIRGIKKNFASFNEKPLQTASNISMNLLNYYQNEFSLFKSIRLVLLSLTDDKSKIRVICDKSLEVYPIEERQIFKIELEAKKEFSLARKMTFIVDGIPPSEELEDLINHSFIILNKFGEL